MKYSKHIVGFSVLLGIVGVFVSSHLFAEAASTPYRLMGSFFKDENANGLRDQSEKTYLGGSGTCEGTETVAGLAVLISYGGNSKSYPVKYCKDFTDPAVGQAQPIGDAVYFVTEPIPLGTLVTASVQLPAGWKSTSPDPISKRVDAKTKLEFGLAPDETLTSSVTLLAPNNGETWVKGKPQTIKWAADASLTTVNLVLYKGKDQCAKSTRGQEICGAVFSADQASATPTSIALGVPNTGSYAWTPSSALPSGADYWIAVQDPNNLPLVDLSDVPFSLKAQSFGNLNDGDLFKATGNPNVYKLDNGVRRSFPSAAVYKTWYKDFSSVKTVKKEEVGPIPLGKPMTVKPGTALVQFEYDASVYEVTPEGDLKKIANEAAAKLAYGKDWNKKIIKLPEIFSLFYAIKQ
ncbi:MAG: GPI anchored serine-threonine rich family protein [bacterium]